MCLLDYIGLRGCSSEVPESGLYVDDLPGFSLDRINALAGSDNPTAEAAWAKIQAQAISLFNSDVQKWMPKDMKLSTIIVDQIAGNSELTEVVETATDEYKGYYIRASGSRHLQAVINRVQYYSAADTTVTFKVFDALDGLELYTQARAVVEGWNHVPLNISIPARGERLEIFVCYLSAVDSMETASWASDGCFCDVNQCSLAKGGRIATSSDVIEGNITFDGGHGMIVPYQIRCGIGGFVCEMRESLKVALQYKMGVQCLIEEMFNPSLFNVFTAMDNEQKKETITYFETIYAQEMESALSSIAPVKDGLCFVCQSPIVVTYKLPG